VTAHHLYGYYLIIQTRYEEAIKEIRKALSLDPLNLITNRTLGDFYYHKRDYDSAEIKLLETLEMNPTFTFTHAYLGLVYLQKGMCDKALIELQNEIKFAIGTEDLAVAWMGYAYGFCGNRQKGYEVLNELIERSRTRHIPPSYFAWIYFALEDYDKGFIWLDKALNEQDPWLTEIMNNHFYDSIRTDKRYVEILELMGLID
jgi:tetratricopeptide (TPR) repeat protein